MEELSIVPKRSVLSKTIPWLIPLFVFGLFGFFLYQGSNVDIVELFTVWTLANAVLAALGCIIARGHILAVLTAALASPITSLNPTLAAGWFAGYVQLKVAEPTAEDLQQFLKLESFVLILTPINQTECLKLLYWELIHMLGTAGCLVMRNRRLLNLFWSRFIMILQSSYQAPSLLMLSSVENIF